jgi:hypothetical protein
MTKRKSRTPMKIALLAAVAGLTATLVIGCGSAPEEGTSPSADALRKCPPGGCEPPPGCDPITDCPAGVTCGTVPDGCGGHLSCGRCPLPLTCGGGGVAHQCGTPPPPTQLCSTFDAVQTALAAGGLYMDPGGHWPKRNVPASAPSTYKLKEGAQSCIWSNQTDALTNTQRILMKAYGCSGPHYFEAHNTNGGVSDPNVHCDDTSPWACWADKSNGFLQLCPDQAHQGPDGGPFNTFVSSIGILTYGSIVSDMPGHFADPTAWNYASAMPSAPAGMVWVITWEDPHACGDGGCMCKI